MQLSGGAAVLIERLGAAGIGVGTFLNGLGVPGLSEVLLPLGGVAVRQGHLNLPTVFVVAMVCQLVGVSVAYVLARSGGLPLIERYGKYVLISPRELERAQRAFERYGSQVILIGSFVPGVQGFVGYVGGVANMSYGRFLMAAAVGKLIWVSALLYLGWLLGNHVGLIDLVISRLGIVILVVVIVAVGWYIYRHRRRTNRQKRETQ